MLKVLWSLGVGGVGGTLNFLVYIGSAPEIAPLADLEGVRLNPPMGPNYFSFMGKFMKNLVKC